MGTGIFRLARNKFNKYYFVERVTFSLARYYLISELLNNFQRDVARSGLPGQRPPPGPGGGGGARWPAGEGFWGPGPGPPLGARRTCHFGPPGGGPGRPEKGPFQAPPQNRRKTPILAQNVTVSARPTSKFAPKHAGFCTYKCFKKRHFYPGAVLISL